MNKVSLLDIDLFRDNGSPDEFYVNTLQNHLQTFHKDISVPHKHDFYVAVLFTHGSGIHEVDFASYSVLRGAFFFLNPGQTHHWELSDDIEGFVFLHTRAFYEQHYTQNRLTRFPFYYSPHNLPVTMLDDAELQRTEQLLKEMISENKDDNLLKRQKLVSLTDLIYIESTRSYLKANTGIVQRGPYSDVYAKFEELIEQKFPELKLPSQYADILNVSPKHLNRIAKAVTGKTASQIIQDRLLLEAKRQLLLHRENFTKISGNLGYEDYGYFSRVFKKHTGETPSAFVERYHKT